MPANRDPRKKSRTARNRRTSSSNRSVRSNASAKDTPKPTSSSTRSTTKGTSKKVTTGKGGNKVSSPRLRQALKEAATPKRRTPAKTPPKKTSTTVNPNNKPEVKGTRGPARAPVQGPKPPRSQGPSKSTKSGLIGSRSKPKTTPKPPPTQKYKPRASNIADQIRQAKDMKTRAAARRVLKAGGTAAQIRRVLTASNPYTLAATIIGSDIMNRGVADGTLRGKPPVAKQGPANPASQPRQFKAPTKKNALVLAKKNGKEGMMRNGTFVPSSWSMSQKARYQAQLNKNK